MSLYLGQNKINQTNIGIEENLQIKTISSTITAQSVLPDSGYTGLSQVNINALNLQSKTVNSSTDIQTITADTGYVGLSQVIINPYTIPIKQLINNDTSITPTGTYATATYYNVTYGVKVGYTSNGNIILSMQSGTSTSYETLYFYAASLPTGASITESHTTSTSYVGGSPGLIYSCVISGLSSNSTYNLSLVMNTINSTYDYTRIDITIL